MSLARLIAIIGAVAGIGALVLQFLLMLNSMSAEGFNPPAIAWRFAGYFTILTNILVAVIWVRAAFNPDVRMPRLEGAGAVAIVMGGSSITCCWPAAGIRKGCSSWRISSTTLSFRSCLHSTGLCARTDR